MNHLTPIYITADPADSAAELRCTDHPDWRTDVDGADLPTAIRAAADHIRADHPADPPTPNHDLIRTGGTTNIGP